MLDDLGELNQLQLDETGDPEIATRIAQYEMAFRMQTSVPELTDLSQGAGATSSSCTARTSRKPGTFAANCLLARRLAERGVRFVQLFHRGWDQHANLPQADPRPVPRHRPAVGRPDHGPEAARPARRHAGRLGRRVRPHGLLPGHADRRRLRPRPPPALLHRSGWPAAASSRASRYGETDDFSYNIAEDPVHVHDLNATILHCLGIDHTRLTFKFQGRDYRLTDVHGNVVKEILA